MQQKWVLKTIWPEAIFDKGSFRKTDKAKLYDCFASVEEPRRERLYIIDGGYLLHKVVWPKDANTTFSDVFDAYITFITSHFKGNVTVIFDGYQTSGLKDVERTRRGSKIHSIQVDVEEQKKVKLQQANFLSSRINKHNFVCKLTEKLNEKNIPTIVAEEDADGLIVHTAIDTWKKENISTIIVGTDVDLLILLTQFTQMDDKVYLLKHDTVTYYGTDSFTKPEYLRRIVAFIHSFCGCDTTSAFHMKGKIKIMDLLQKDKNRQLLDEILYFYEDNADQNRIIDIGNKIINLLYSGAQFSPKRSLNDLRYLSYKKNVRKLSFSITSLPPTESAGGQHSLRVYCQIMKWKMKKIQVTEWGWEMKDNEFHPTMLSKDMKPVPNNILKIISCKCESRCAGNCGCVKNNLKCSEYCANCLGKNCNNSEVLMIESEFDLQSIYIDSRVKENDSLQENVDSDIEFSESENDSSEDENDDSEDKNSEKEDSMDKSSGNDTAEPVKKKKKKDL